ncbi:MULTISPECIES: hypothetical protein [unclassified Gilliamella]|jgi:hypothetical protein|nr:hypothetical protein [Gilliamella apicola]
MIKDKNPLTRTELLKEAIACVKEIEKMQKQIDKRLEQENGK